MLIQNATLLTDDFSFTRADLRFSEKIEAIGNLSALPQEEVLDAGGRRLIPGLIDVHTHGAIGEEATDANCNYRKWRDYLLSRGVTTFLPTLVTATEAEIAAALANLREADGINLEGPFLSWEKRGAHDETKLCEVDMAMLARFRDQIKITTIAPEVGDNLSKIQAVTKLGIRVSIGHCAADYETCRQAFADGATQVTHAFNAMSPLHHREPALMGAAMDSDSVFCEVIADGFHLHPAVVRMLFRVFGAERIVLISDALSATGLPDGECLSGGLKVTIKNGEARLTDGTIAGSTSDLLKIANCAISFGIPQEDVFRAATLTAARSVGMDADRGSITVGKKADLVLLSDSGAADAVFHNGTKIQ